MKKFCAILLATGALLFSGATISAAATEQGQPPSPAVSPNSQAGSCDPKLDKAATVPPPDTISQTAQTSTPLRLELGQLVSVEIPQGKYNDYFTKKSDNLTPTPVLYINDVAINGLAWQAGGCNKVVFTLERTADSRDVWGRLLSRLDGKIVTIGIGTAQKGFVTEIGNAELVLIHGDKKKFWILAMASLVVATFWLGVKSGMLRDLPTNPGNSQNQTATASQHAQNAQALADNVKKNADATIAAANIATSAASSITQKTDYTPPAAMPVTENPPALATIATRTPHKRIEAQSRPYSLGRVQMAFWFLLASGAFTYIWLMTGDIGDMPPSILALMGISAGTTVLAAVIDANAAPAAAQEHVTFIQDLLTDDDGATEGGGISFHRFQMVVWTVILGGVFISKVWQTLSMPDFDAQLLGLMGVASGTYLGFKMPSMQTAAQQGSQPPKTPS